MLSQPHVEDFSGRGFIVLRGMLDDLADELCDETERALKNAYGARYSERFVDGISGHYLPMASRFTPTSMTLVCDDRRFIDAAEKLLGGPVLPRPPEGVLYFYDAGWHNDDGIGVKGVKFATYFEPLETECGALRFVPGTHLLEPTALRRCKRREPRSYDLEKEWVRSVAVPTEPGDVLAFDFHTWHASFGGRDRLAWTIEYQLSPETEHERALTLESLEDSFEQGFRGFDRQRYPVWRDWLEDAASHPLRAPLIERMRRCGIWDVRGALVGW